MATRSVIAKLDRKNYEEGGEYIEAIYCHNDGYLSNNGKILDQHYQGIDKVNELLVMGDISSLKDTIADSTFYHRDRKDPYSRVKAVTLIDETKLLKFAFKECDAEVVYMFAYGSWYVYDNSTTIGDASYQFIELEEALYVK